MSDLRKLDGDETGMNRALTKEQWYLVYSQEINKSQQAVGQLSSQALLHSERSIAQQAISQFETKIGQQATVQLTQIPWGHNIEIISKCKNLD